MTFYFKMNIVHVMMNSVTTKDEILEAAKREAKDKGLESIGMREIARASNIALGTLYNYFPNKDVLILSTISSIWKEAIEKLEEEKDFISAVSTVYDAILSVYSDYSGFLSAHAKFLKGNDEGRKEMGEAQRELREYLSSSIDNDLKAKIIETMEEEKFSEFILTNIIFSCMKKEKPEILETLILNYIRS